jgi:protein-L-isoaspartate(D-aspartate) O-methyltransferase
MSEASSEFEKRRAEREEMVERQIARRGVRSEPVLRAMRRVPRHAFVPASSQSAAYDDSQLPIGTGQTISQPYIVAYMTELLELEPDDRVLEIGTGSGYAAAVLAEIVDEVFTVERHPNLAETAEKRFAELGYENVHVREGDGTKGWPEAGPFDAIVVAAGGPRVPESLKHQLAEGGRLVIPVGSSFSQQLVRIRRVGDEEWKTENLSGVRFVPLVGEEGWDSENP